jgi:hypothetical protein
MATTHLMAVTEMMMVMTIVIPRREPNLGVAMVVARVNRSGVVNGRGRDDYRWRADGWRRDVHGPSGDDNSRDGDPDVYAKRNAGTRRGGGGSSEGDCDCGNYKYLFHTYQFDGVFIPVFIA